MFEWTISVMEAWGYPGIIFLMIAEHAFPPIPSEVILPLAGFLAGRGDMSLPWVLVAGTFGSVAGTMIWYYIGMWIGEARLKRWATRHGRWLTLSPSDIDHARDWFERYGAAAVFFGRMLPAIRTLISVPAGLARMPVGKFLLYTTLGSLIWTVLLVVAGMILHENHELVVEYIDPLSNAIVLTIIAVYLYRVITWKPH